jgi:gluconokinase
MSDRPVGQYVVMGVSGSGKSSVARLLAEKTGGVFLDADNFHPPANVVKMSRSIPLTDEDRWPWLNVLNGEMKRRAAGGELVFLACSALKQIYRDRLSAGIPTLRFIYLEGSKELIRDRMRQRKDHFMPASLLDSQFAALEVPADAITVPIAETVPAIVDDILRRI